MKFIKDQYTRNPEGIGIDVMFGGGIDPFRELQEDGLFQPYEVKNIKELPEEILGVPLHDVGHYWHGAALSSFGIVYNRQVLKERGVDPPTTWEDMTNPKLMGAVGMADPSQSGSARAIYEVILQAYGWEKGMRIITLMSANAREFYSGSGGLVKDVALGQVGVAPAIDFYGYTQIAEAGGDVVGFVLPERLTVITPDAIAMLKGAPHPKTAKMFLDYVLSEAGQRLWMLKAGAEGGPVKHNLLRMPVLPALYDKYAAQSTVKMNPFTFTKGFEHDEKKGSERRVITADLMQNLMMKPQDELRACWKAVQKVPFGESAKLIAEMTKVPVTEKEALDLARNRWNDKRLRAEKTTEWVNNAISKYKRVQAEAEKAAAE